MIEQENNELNEPLPSYGKKRIQFFNSLEEENESQYEYWRSLTPEQRLEEHRILSLHVFSNAEKYSGNRIVFD